VGEEMSHSKHEIDLLTKCHRRCCICHKFCGVKIEIHHIEQRAKGGSDDISNLIAVCFECHAEIKLYNPKHPKGRRFTPEELRYHRDQWLKICEESPGALIDSLRSPNPGSLEKLFHELEYNERITQFGSTSDEFGCPFETNQFGNLINDGTFSWLQEKVRVALTDAYIKMKRANRLLDSAIFSEHPNQKAAALNKASHSFKLCKESIQSALSLIRKLLGSDSSGENR